MRLLRLVLAALFFLPGGIASVSAESSIAVLVMAVGGSSQWNKTVKRAVRSAALPYPHEIYFGMGDSPAELHELQAAIDDLEGKGAHTIVVVPLLVSSYSEVSRQWKYLLGIDVQPGFINNPVFPVNKHARIRFSEPLNDSSIVVEILFDRIREISANPAKEGVIIISHGPNDDEDNKRWLEVMGRIADRVRERGGFRSVQATTLRDDAPSAVRSRAVQILRDRVGAIEKRGDRALVIPLLLTPGGIEHKVSLELRGFTYAFTNKTLLPDSRISEWIRSQIPE